MSTNSNSAHSQDSAAQSLTRRSFVALTGGSVLAAVLFGCGGGGAGAVKGRGGRVQVKIAWPEKQRSAPVPAAVTAGAASRYIPAYAASLFFELYLPATPDDRFNLVVNRPSDLPSTQTVEFDGLIPVGTYVIACAARLEAGGQGSTVASAASNVTVTAGATATTSLTLNSTIKTLEIQGQPLSVQVGASLNLIGHALDPDGMVVLLPGDALKWSLVSGAAAADLTAAGLFTAKAPGAARVRLEEQGANISTESDVTVAVAASGGLVLANTPWPKTRGDFGNTGQGKGQGATGVIKWELPLKQGERGLKGGYLIGLDGTVLVAATQGVFGIDPATGAEKWRNTTVHTGQGSIPLLTADGRLLLIEQSFGSNVGSGPTILDSANGNILLRTAQLDRVSDVYLGPDGTIYTYRKAQNINQNTSFLHADTLTGDTITPKWNREASTIARIAISLDGRIFTTQISGVSRSLFALDAATGNVIWEYNTQSLGAFTAPVLGPNGLVYCGVVNRLIAINASGQKVWEYIDPSLGNTLAPAIGADGTVYVQIAGNLFAMDGGTGTEIWRLPLSTFGAAGDASREPVIGPDGTVYICDSAGVLAVEQYIDNGMKKARIKWRVTFPRRLVTARSPLIMGGDGTLYTVGSVSSGLEEDSLFAIG